MNKTKQEIIKQLEEWASNCKKRASQVQILLLASILFETKVSLKEFKEKFLDNKPKLSDKRVYTYNFADRKRVEFYKTKRNEDANKYYHNPKNKKVISERNLQKYHKKKLDKKPKK